uniref:FCH domain-containing protein n=1 Tax=Meloidogyne javanica TaxID=6303 RepID=A0A915LU89_MELJA
MTYRKVSQQDLQHQSREIRSQLFEQIKCLEQRSNDKVAIFQEINDFLKKRAELDLQYSKELDKLVKSVMMRHKAERQRRPNWSIYSICNLWQQIVDDAKDEAKQRSIIADVCANYIIPGINNKCNSLQKMSKKCRDIALLAAGEVMRVLNELSLAMKTYHNCYNEFSVLSAKLHNAEEQKRKIMEANTLANLSGFRDSLQSRDDKQRFFESSNQTFMLPKRFDFKCEQSETIFEISTNDLREEFKQRHNQIRKRLEILRMESEGSWQKLVEMEKKMQELLAVSTIVEINEFGISDKRPSTELVEQELSNIFESYLQSFTFFLLNANLISRLEARANGINIGLKYRNINVASSKQNISDGDRLNGNSSIEKKSDTDGSEIETIIHQRPKRRIGSQTSTECQFSSPWTLRPKLFGGSLEQYTDGTGEQIPLVVVSCIRALSLFALQHQGDTYNLAICFGPTLLPIPEGKDQVIYQNSVNEVIKNLIVHCNEIFDEKLPGPKYEKYNLNSGLDTPADTELELFVDDESGIDGLDGDGKQWSCGSVEASLFPYNYKNPQNIVPFLGRPIQLPNFCEQPQFCETINERELNFLNSENFNQTGCITSPSAKNRATLREQKLTATGRREIQPEKFNDDFYTKYSLEVDRSMDHEETSSSNIIMGTENVRNNPHNKLYSSIDRSTKTTASSKVPNTEELEVNDPTRFLSFYNPKTFPNENVKSHNPRQIGTNKGQMPSAIAIEGGRQCNKIDDLLNKLALQSNEKEAKIFLNFKLRARENGSVISKTITKLKKPLNLQIRSLKVSGLPLTRDGPHSSSVDEMIEQLQKVKQSLGNEMEKQFKMNPITETPLNEDQDLPDNLNVHNTELNDKFEDMLRRIDLIQQQIKAVSIKCKEERAKRLKVFIRRDGSKIQYNYVLEQIASLEEKLQERFGNDQINMDITQNALTSEQTNELINQNDNNIPLVDSEDILIDNDISIMPQLEKATDSQLDVEIIGEVLHDYKIGLPAFKKESASNQLTEWPVLTLESDYSENNDITSSRNT